MNYSLVREAAIKEREKKISQIKASEAKAQAAVSEDSAKKWEAQLVISKFLLST